MNLLCGVLRVLFGPVISACPKTEAAEPKEKIL